MVAFDRNPFQDSFEEKPVKIHTLEETISSLSEEFPIISSARDSLKFLVSTYDDFSKRPNREGAILIEVFVRNFFEELLKINKAGLAVPLDIIQDYTMVCKNCLRILERKLGQKAYKTCEYYSINSFINLARKYF